MRRSFVRVSRIVAEISTLLIGLDRSESSARSQNNLRELALDTKQNYHAPANESMRIGVRAWLCTKSSAETSSSRPERHAREQGWFEEPEIIGGGNGAGSTYSMMDLGRMNSSASSSSTFSRACPVPCAINHSSSSIDIAVQPTPASCPYQSTQTGRGGGEARPQAELWEEEMSFQKRRFPFRSGDVLWED